MRIIQSKAKQSQSVVKVNTLEKQAIMKHKQSVVKATTVFEIGGIATVSIITRPTNGLVIEGSFNS
tara:strand:- start:22327 stop:22524 length:198 start_codon:yes stop_codon:yes gene_type:complete